MSQTTTDHATIRRWAEARGGKPAAVRATEDDDRPGALLRIAFPGQAQSDDDALDEISWDEWFRQFDANGLALVYEDQTKDGQQSRFNKLVSRD